MGEYDATAMHQHAQHLFDSWDQDALPGLHEWLSRRHIDANVAPHSYILHLIQEEAANGDAIAIDALGSEAHTTESEEQ